MRYLFVLLLSICAFPVLGQSVETYALREAQIPSTYPAPLVEELPFATVRELPDEQPNQQLDEQLDRWSLQPEPLDFASAFNLPPSDLPGDYNGLLDQLAGTPPVSDMMFVTVDEQGQAIDETPQERALEQAWLDALLIEQINLDLRLVGLGLTQDEMDLVLALRLEACPSTTSPRLGEARAVLHCRVRQTLEMLAARER